MTYLPDSAVQWIVVHYSASFIDTEYAYKTLEADHISRGYREAGYHYYITRERPGKPAKIYAGRDLTQPGRFEMGAHSKGENGGSIGICFEGGLTRADPHTGKNTLTPSQTDLLVKKIRELKRRFPKAIVEGHRDMPGAATQCPGFDVAVWWAGVEREQAWKSKRRRSFWDFLVAIFGGQK